VVSETPLSAFNLAGFFIARTASKRFVIYAPEPAFLSSAVLLFGVCARWTPDQATVHPQRREGTEDDMGAASQGGVDAKHFQEALKASPEMGEIKKKLNILAFT
jgi:hypothetical protein